MTRRVVMYYPERGDPQLGQPYSADLMPLEFLRIIRPALETKEEEALDAEARFRRAVEMQSAIWAETPPENPILIAGSTGSRGATAELMAAIAHLPQGAVILPGHDRDMPADILQSDIYVSL